MNKLFTFCIFLLLAVTVSAQYTALQEYVNAPDSNYNFVADPTYNVKGQGWTAHYINMTSQRWMTDNITDRSLWWHHMMIIVPDNIDPSFTNNALVYVTGGKNTDSPPTKDKELYLCAFMAYEIRTVVTVLYQIPNQPMKFWEETPVPKSRTEDAILAWAWRHYIDDPTADPLYLVRLPMTKAVVRAMDTTTLFVQKLNGNNIEQFIVAGASKRGWTTWTVGACDPRIIAIAPMVLDELNFVHNIHHHYRAYGGWSFALKDYWSLNLTAEFDSPKMAEMMSIVDPLAYKNILTMPKLILTTGGDEFLLPDDVLYFWNDLKGEKHFRQFPNLEHTMMENPLEVIGTIMGFALSIQTSTARPSYNWSIAEDGTLSLWTSQQPLAVNLWYANTIDGPARRDFRLVACPLPSCGKPWLHLVLWTEVKNVNATVNAPGNYVYEAYRAPPSNGGWVAFILEVTWAGARGANFTVSSAPSILPQTFPNPDCSGEGCLGILV